MSKWQQHVYFPREFLELQLEIENHPKLIELLGKHAPNEFEIRMAEICSYCEVILDGDYTEGDFTKLAKICTQKLWNKRVSPNVLLLGKI
jgi:hypothetical protein